MITTAAIGVCAGIPLVYELDADLKPVAVEGCMPGLKHRYVADPAVVKAMMDKVANQGKAK